MHNMKSETDVAPRGRRVWRWIGYGVLALVALLLIASGVFSWWLWGWRLGGLHFHDSWTPEQRAEMQGLADDMRGFQRFVVDSSILHVHDGLIRAVKLNADGTSVHHYSILTPLEEEIVAALCAKYVAAPILSTLKRIAADGVESCSPEDAGIVAQAALRTFRTSLAKKLIVCGADVNASFARLWNAEGEEGERVFQSVIAGKRFCNYAHSDAVIPLAERLSLLKLMREHGADFSYDRAISLLLAYVSAASESEPDHGAMLECLLDNGLTIVNPDEVENMAMVLSCNGTLPAFQRIVQKGQIPLTPENKARLLNRIVMAPSSESEAKALWALEELGADPNYLVMFTVEDEDEDGNPIQVQKPDSPLVEKIARYLPLHETEEEKQYALRLLEILLAHGAHLPDDAAALVPEDAALRDRYLETLKKASPLPEREPEGSKVGAEG